MELSLGHPLHRVPRSARFDAGRLDHLAPLAHFRRHISLELLRRENERCSGNIGEPRLKCESASPALSSRFSRSMISGGGPRVMPTPAHPPASLPGTLS